MMAADQLALTAGVIAFQSVLIYALILILDGAMGIVEDVSARIDAKRSRIRVTRSGGQLYFAAESDSDACDHLIDLSATWPVQS